MTEAIIQSLILVGAGAVIATIAPPLFAWLRFRRWRMMPKRHLVRRLRDRIRWIRALRSIDRMLHRAARDHYADKAAR